MVFQCIRIMSHSHEVSRNDEVFVSELKIYEHATYIITTNMYTHRNQFDLQGKWSDLPNSIFGGKLKDSKSTVFQWYGRRFVQISSEEGGEKQS